MTALRLHQPPMDLPALILSRTESLPAGLTLPDSLVGVHLRTVLSLVRAEPEWDEPASDIRSRLRVRSVARLVGILCGEDDLLESLWKLDPGRFFTRLRAARIGILTGPAYSVYGEHPASHNVVMMLRHHRFCADAAAEGFAVIPNLYWSSLAGRKEWVSWLRDNPTVRYIARDFSCTKQRASFSPELKGLLEILEAIPRPITVLITGVAEKKIEETRGALQQVGAAASFVSPRAVVAPPGPLAALLPAHLRSAAILGRIEGLRALADGSARSYDDDALLRSLGWVSNLSSGSQGLYGAAASPAKHRSWDRGIKRRTR